MAHPPQQRHTLTRTRRSTPHAAVAALLLLALSAGLSSCSLGGIGGQSTAHAVNIVAVFPATGPSSSLGQAMGHAVDLAVKQQGALGGGYTLTVAHVDEASVGVDASVAQAAAAPQTMGVVGPFGSSAAAAILPGLAQAGVATISPTATLPGLTKADQAAAEGLTFNQLHLQGKPANFFRLTADDNAIGATAASMALASTQAHGLGAHSVYVVNDGSPSGKAQAAAFQSALKAGHGALAGTATITAGDEISVQTGVSSIIEAAPDAVFYAGDETLGADLRRTLTLTGAPQLGILTAGASADDPGWGALVGNPVVATNTTSLLPAQDLATAAGGKSFVTAFQAAYPGASVTPQVALAYDAAMVEISAIKSVIAAKQAPTRAAILSAIAGAKYAGVTGQIAFDKNGDPTTTPGFAIYTCDQKGAWSYQSPFAGSGA